MIGWSTHDVIALSSLLPKFRQRVLNSEVIRKDWKSKYIQGDCAIQVTGKLHAPSDYYQFLALITHNKSYYVFTDKQR